MPTNTHHTKLTVAIPTYNEVANIERVVRGFLSTGYPNLIEVLVADGGSTDGTQDIVKNLALEDSRVKLIHNPLKVQSAGLNLILEECNGDIFLIVGNVSEENEKYKLSDMVDNDKVRHYPAVYGTDKWKLLAASDAFVHLSHRENFCYSVIEAAAAGLPLLISDGVDTFPVFKDCGAADVLSINSINDIREGLNNFLIKPKLQHIQMGKMAKNVFQQNFTQKCFEEELINLVTKYSQKKNL